MLLARMLGADGYGYYAYAIALIQIMTIPTVMGLPQLIIRNMAAYFSLKDFGRMRGLLIRANQFIFGGSILLVGVAAGIALGFSDRLTPIGLQTFLISLLLLPLLGLKNLRMAALRGLRHVVLGLMPEKLLRPLFFILLLAVGLLFLPQRLSPQLAMAFQVLATGFALIAAVFFLARSLPPGAKEKEAAYETRQWLKSALPFMVLGAMQLVNQRTDILMLGIFSSMEEVGIYRTVVQGARLVTFALVAVNMALAPVIAGIYAEKNLERLQRMVTVAARAILIGTIPIALILIFAAHWFLVVFFGPEFGDGANALRILCFGQLVNAGMGSVGIILNMTGHEKYAVAGVAIAALMNIGLNLVLVPLYGLVGAATATAISLSVWNILLAWWVYARVGIHSTALGRIGY